MTIGKTLKLLRVAADLSQGRLARELKFTPGYLSLVEGGKRQPSLSFLEAAANRFRIPVGLLMLDGTTVDALAPKQRKLVQQIRRDLIDYILMGKFGTTPRDAPRPSAHSRGRK